MTARSARPDIKRSSSSSDKLCSSSPTFLLPDLQNRVKTTRAQFHVAHVLLNSFAAGISSSVAAWLRLIASRLVQSRALLMICADAFLTPCLRRSIFYTVEIVFHRCWGGRRRIGHARSLQIEWIVICVRQYSSNENRSSFIEK